MSGIKEKLLRMKRSVGSGAGEGSDAGSQIESVVSADRIMEDESESSGSLASDHFPKKEALDPCWARLGVQVKSHDQGAFLIRERRYGLDYAHGMHDLGELQGRTNLFSSMTSGTSVTSGAEVAEVLEGTEGRTSSSSFSIEELLFLDTETTGLGVGTGNVPFMIGIGFYEADEFVVQQLFIRNPAEERGMLAYLQETMETRNRLVTYNGKCFDWPLVKNRFILNRLRTTGAEPDHYDLLYPSRSLWRRSLPSCRLSIVEKARLGLSRMDDVPGSMAPALYFLYLAEEKPDVLSGVFEHNEKDVLTLATLSVHLAKLLEGIIPMEQLDEEELYRLALWMEKLGESAKAMEAIDSLISRPTIQHSEIALLCAAFYKRRHRYDLAVPIWRELATAAGRSGLTLLEPLLELAMYYEHRERDIAEALYMAEQALNRAWSRLSLTRGDKKQREACEQLQQRIARLRKKAAGGTQKRTAPRAATADRAVSRSASQLRRSPQPRTAEYANTLFTAPHM